MGNKRFVLSNGMTLSSIGFGTYKSKNGQEAFSAVLNALECGYRLIDTAEFYGNEESIGKAVKASGLARAEVQITSKVWNTNRGYDNTMRAFERSLKTLGTDYMDLYLIHWPANSIQYSEPDKVNLDTYKALISLYEQGVVKAIGVSNFKPHHLEPLMYTNIKPMVNQIEFHPGFMQSDTVAFCKDNDILVEAWSPMARGEIFAHPVIDSLSKKYNCTPAQLCVRWCLQHGVLPLPKSVTPERIKSNKDVFFFGISDEDMRLINSMTFCGGSGHDSDRVEF